MWYTRDQDQVMWEQSPTGSSVSHGETAANGKKCTGMSFQPMTKHRIAVLWKIQPGKQGVKAGNRSCTYSSNGMGSISRVARDSSTQ